MLNVEAENILTYFQTKLSSILPYSIQVCLIFLRDSVTITLNRYFAHQKEKMRHLKNDVGRLQAKIFSLQKVLKVLIEDDETMALMNLSKLRANPDIYR